MSSRLSDEQRDELEADARKATFAFRMSPQQGLSLLSEVRRARLKEKYAEYLHTQKCHLMQRGTGPGCTCGLSALEASE